MIATVSPNPNPNPSTQGDNHDSDTNTYCWLRNYDDSAISFVFGYADSNRTVLWVRATMMSLSDAVFRAMVLLRVLLSERSI